MFKNFTRSGKSACKFVNVLFKGVSLLSILASARKGEWDKGQNDGGYITSGDNI